MKIKRSELLQALNAVKPGLATKSVVQQMEHVIFTGQDIITYNEQTGILYPFETEFEASVNYNDLYKIITKIKKDEIDLTVEGSELLITTKTTKAGLVTMNTGEIDESLNGLINQLPDEENGLEWQNLPSDFIDGALLCIPATSRDLSQGTLACLYVNGTNMICSDNQRVSWYELSEAVDAEFFIRAGTIRELASFDIKRLCVSESWVHFITENDVVFSTRLIRGKSFNYFLDMFDGFKGTAVKLPEGLKALVDAAAVMAEDEDVRNMKITLREGEMICATQNARGWIEEPVPIKFNKKTPIDFQVSAVFLQQILNLPLQMTVGKNKSLFESGAFKHILLHKAKKKEVGEKL